MEVKARRKGVEKTLWIIITAVVGIIVIYILIQMGVISLGKVNVTVQSALDTSTQTINDVLNQITQGLDLGG